MKWGIHSRLAQITKARAVVLPPTYFTINSYYDDIDGTSLCTAVPRGAATVY